MHHTHEGEAAVGSDADWPFVGFQLPTYTPTPNVLFDGLMDRLTGAELKVLLYIVRRTLGFKKQAEVLRSRKKITSHFG